jgi:hypothetical protein
MGFKLCGPGSTLHGAWWIVLYGEIGFYFVLHTVEYRWRFISLLHHGIENNI